MAPLRRQHVSGVRGAALPGRRGLEAAAEQPRDYRRLAAAPRGGPEDLPDGGRLLARLRHEDEARAEGAAGRPVRAGREAGAQRGQESHYI